MQPAKQARWRAGIATTIVEARDKLGEIHKRVSLALRTGEIGRAHV